MTDKQVPLTLSQEGDYSMVVNEDGTIVLIPITENDIGPEDPDEYLMEEDAPASFSTDIGTLPADIVVGATLTVTDPTWTMNGDPYTSPSSGRQWRRDELDISGATGTTYTTTAADVGHEIDVAFLALNGETGDQVQTFSPRVGPVRAVDDPDPDDPPEKPDDADWDFGDSYFDPDLAGETFRPVVSFDPGETVADAQWTTSGSVPALDTHWETLQPTGNANEYIPVMLNESDTDYGLFTEGQRRREQFRIRYRTSSVGEWSPESNAKTVPEPEPYEIPPAVDGFDVTPGDNDGEIIVAMSEQTEWGDGTEGTREWWNVIDGWQTFTGISQKFTLDATLHGKSTSIRARAVNGEDVPGVELSKTVTVPGESTGGTTRDDLWRVLPLPSKEAFESQSNYRYGLGGFQYQFMHCGDRSPVDPNLVCFGQDVSVLWFTQDAESEFPYFYMPRHNNLGCRYSGSVRFDPEIRERVLYLGVNSAAGIFESNDIGESFVKRKGFTSFPGGSNAAYGGKYRANRELLVYDPDDFSTWYCLNPKDIHHSGNAQKNDAAIWKSTNRGVSWTQVSSDPETKNVGMVWKIQVLPGSGHLLVGSETGLWKSTNGGSTLTKLSPSGLPSGHITWFDVNPNDPDDIYVCVYETGCYRTTNGGTSFSGHKIGNFCQIYVSPANRNVQWLIGINKIQPNSSNDGAQKSLYTANGGNSWQEFQSDTSTYGWTLGSGFSNLNAGGDTKTSTSDNREEMQTVLLPHPTNATNSMYSAKARIYAGTGRSFVCASDGVDQTGSGHANAHGNLVWDPQNKNRLLLGGYDRGVHISANNGKSWIRTGHSSPSHTNGAYALSVSPDNPNHIVATAGLYSSEATVIVSRNGGSSWSQPGDILSDKDQGEDTPKPHHTFASFALVPGAGNYIHTDHHISEDTGATWEKWSSYGSGFPSGYDAKIAGLSYQNSKVLYCVNDGQTACFRTTNRGKNWSQYCAFGKSLKSQRQPLTFTVDPDDDSVVYWWVKGTGLRKYDGSSTTTLCQNIKDKGVTAVRFDLSDTNNMYFMTAENGGPQVYRSTDRGVSAHDISANLPQAQSNRGIEVDPYRGIVFCLGTAGTRYLGPPNPNADAVATLADWEERFPQRFFSPWNESETINPGSPQNFAVSPGSSAGQIVVTMNNPASWGSGSAGVIQWHNSVGGWQTFNAGTRTLTLDTSLHGKTTTIQARSRNSDGNYSTVLSESVAVPGSVDTTALPAPSSSVLSFANTKALTTYTTDHVRNATTQGTSRIGPSSVVMAYAAFLGTTSYDTKILNHVRELIRSGYEPPCGANYATQHECNATGLFALVRLTSRLWSALTATEQGKVTTIMRASAAVCAWLLSVNGAAVTTQLDGVSINRANKNSNHVCPKGATMVICAAFFGQTTLHDWLRNYDHDDFRSELSGYSFTNILNWFKATPNGTTKATFETKIRNGTLGNSTGWKAWYNSNPGVSDPIGIMYRECYQKLCSKKVVRGIGSNQEGINDGGTKYGTMISNRTGLPGYNQDGGFEEFDSFDGNGDRSDIGYVVGGYSPVTIAIFCSIAAGQWDKDDATAQTIIERFKIGHDDLAYKIRKSGYRDYSLGQGKLVWPAANNMTDGMAGQHGMIYRLYMGDAILRYHGLEPNL